MSSLLGKQLELKIESLSVGGQGVARHNNFVIFVPFSAPGDLVLAEVKSEKSSYAIADILEIKQASPERVEPPCPYYYECGGCNWQHLSHKAQLRNKQKIIQESLQKFLKTEIPLPPILPSPEIWRYRNRIQLAYDGKNLGFRRRKSHSIIDVKDCLITEEPLVKVFDTIRSGATPNSRIELYLNSQLQPEWENFASERESIGFSQVNRFQNETIKQVLSQWQLPDAQNILELYAGSGNFTFSMAAKNPKAKITAVELNADLLRLALTQQKDPAKLSFISSDAESFLRRWNINQHDLIFLDPPRSGATEYIMKALAWSEASQIIYLSCHPASLGRDLAWFFSANATAPRKYQLKRIQAFEMFPQTDHVETLVELRVD